MAYMATVNGDGASRQEEAGWIIGRSAIAARPHPGARLGREGSWRNIAITLIDLGHRFDPGQ
jgi:hypothetical protein